MPQGRRAQNLHWPPGLNQDFKKLTAEYDSAFLGWSSVHPSVQGFNKSIAFERESSGTGGIDLPEFCDFGEQRADTIAL